MLSKVITAEVVFALPARQKLVTVTLQPGARVADAISASGLLRDFSDTDIAGMPVGIWGRLVERENPVQDGDRVEIYRPLERDPREARRELARAQRLGSSS